MQQIGKLKFNAKIKIKEGLKGASKGYYPISWRVKEENNALYCIVLNRRGKSESVC